MSKNLTLYLLCSTDRAVSDLLTIDLIVTLLNEPDECGTFRIWHINHLDYFAEPIDVLELLLVLA